MYSGNSLTRHFNSGADRIKLGARIYLVKIFKYHVKYYTLNSPREKKA